MPQVREISFITRKIARRRPEFDIVNCEKLYLADVDGDSRPEIIIPRWGSTDENYTGEIMVYDLDLNLKASDRWDGIALDVAVADIDKDGKPEMVVAGAIKNSVPMIRVYKYNENYKGNLSLSSQISWKAPEGLFSFAKAIHILDRDDQSVIAVLAIAEGRGESNGYAQLRLYSADMQLMRIVRWTPLHGNIVRWGHCMKAADIDGDGNDELLTLVNFRYENTQRADLRIFDHRLTLKGICESLKDEATFATCMSAADIDKDGKTEIVVAGGIFADVWKGATNQLTVFDDKLSPKGNTTWKTFRHSWVWDLQIADVDNDGAKEIITYGGTSMRGKNQEDANIMGEICIWDCHSLTAKDMFIWQSMPGEDTRPSRGLAFDSQLNSDGGSKLFITTTSRWSRGQKVQELELRALDYKPSVDAIRRYSSFIKAYSERDVETLESFVPQEFITAADVEQEFIFAPLTLEALAIISDAGAVAVAGRFLDTRDQPLFLRTVELMREIGAEAIDQLRRIGFAHPDNWALISPFDNTNNIGFHALYPPETDINFSAFYPGKDRIVRWGKIDDYTNDIYIDLAYAHFDSFERTGIEFNWNFRRTESVAYLLTYICSPESMEAQFRVGSADGIKLWLDNELKLSLDVSREAAPDQDIVPVYLTKGKNRVLLKVTNYNSNSWGFYFRVTDSEGRYIPGLQYERPETWHIHNQMLKYEHLASLLGSQNEYLRCLAARQLALLSDKHGNQTLFELLQSKDEAVRAKSALALILAGDNRGADQLVKSAPGQDHLFQIVAGHALKNIGDPRAEMFSIENLKDDAGKNVVEISVTNRENGFRVSPVFRGDETAHVEVGANRRFHLGDNICAKYATIASFGIRQPSYRGMGLGEMVIKKSLDLIAEMGHTCTTVSTGIKLLAHRLYCRIGFVDRRFPWRYEKHLKREEFAERDDRITARDYTEADKPDLQRLIQQYSLNTVGPADWSPRSNFGLWTKIVEAEGKLIGYADVHLDPFVRTVDINFLYIDANFQDKQIAARVLLSYIQNYALEEDKDTIVFIDPPMRYRNIVLGMGYQIDPSALRHGWVGMFRVMDLPGILREMAGLLRLRLQRSPHCGWHGSICLKGSRLRATIAIDKSGNVYIEESAAENADISVITDDRIITSLVSGDCDIWDAYRQDTLTIRPVFNELTRSLIEFLLPVIPCKQNGWW